MSHLRRVWFLCAAMVLSVASLPFTPGRALGQDASTGDIKDNGGRKVKSAVKPVYPDVARKMHVAGTVRLEATVAPDGKVRDTRIIGGSPILAQEAASAVKKWKYEEAPKETVEVVEVVYQ